MADVPERLRALAPFWGTWQLDALLGEGAYGSVYRIRREDYGRVYYSALKWIPLPQNKTESNALRSEGMSEVEIQAHYRLQVEELSNEIALLSKLRGTAHVVSYEDHLYVERQDEIGWDILIRMELLTPLQQKLQQGMTVGEVLRMGEELAEALMLCQAHKIIHRDIKLDNIFLSDNGDYKLGDFGVARQLEKTAGTLSRKGTPYYMAPEVYFSKPYDATVDIYSLGLVLYRLLNRQRLPFSPTTLRVLTPAQREQAFEKRLSGAPLPPPEMGNARVKKAILTACAFEPAKRYRTPKAFRDALREAARGGGMELPLLMPLEGPQGQPSGSNRVGSGTGQRKPEPPGKRKKRALPWVFAGAGILACGLLLYVYAGRQRPVTDKGATTPAPTDIGQDATALPTETPYMVVLPVEATPSPTAQPTPAATERPTPAPSPAPSPSPRPSPVAKAAAVPATEKPPVATKVVTQEPTAVIAETPVVTASPTPSAEPAATATPRPATPTLPPSTQAPTATPAFTYAVAENEEGNILAEFPLGWQTGSGADSLRVSGTFREEGSGAEAAVSCEITRRHWLEPVRDETVWRKAQKAYQEAGQPLGEPGMQPLRQGQAYVVDQLRAVEEKEIQHRKAFFAAGECLYEVNFYAPARSFSQYEEIYLHVMDTLWVFEPPDTPERPVLPTWPADAAFLPFERGRGIAFEIPEDWTTSSQLNTHSLSAGFRQQVPPPLEALAAECFVVSVAGNGEQRAMDALGLLEREMAAYAAPMVQPPRIYGEIQTERWAGMPSYMVEYQTEFLIRPQEEGITYAATRKGRTLAIAYEDALYLVEFSAPLATWEAYTPVWDHLQDTWAWPLFQWGNADTGYEPLGLWYRQVTYESTETSGETALSSFLLPQDFSKEEASFGLRLRALDADLREVCSVYISSEPVLDKSEAEEEAGRAVLQERMDLALRERQRFGITGEAGVEETFGEPIAVSGMIWKAWGMRLDAEIVYPAAQAEGRRMRNAYLVLACEGTLYHIEMMCTEEAWPMYEEALTTLAMTWAPGEDRGWNVNNSAKGYRRTEMSFRQPLGWKWNAGEDGVRFDAPVRRDTDWGDGGSLWVWYTTLDVVTDESYLIKPIDYDGTVKPKKTVWQGRSGEVFEGYDAWRNGTWKTRLAVIPAEEGFCIIEIAAPLGQFPLFERAYHQAQDTWVWGDQEPPAASLGPAPSALPEAPAYAPFESLETLQLHLPEEGFAFLYPKGWQVERTHADAVEIAGLGKGEEVPRIIIEKLQGVRETTAGREALPALMRAMERADIGISCLGEQEVQPQQAERFSLRVAPQHMGGIYPAGVTECSMEFHPADLKNGYEVMFGMAPEEAQGQALYGRMTRFSEGEDEWCVTMYAAEGDYAEALAAYTDVIRSLAASWSY